MQLCDMEDDECELTGSDSDAHDWDTGSTDSLYSDKDDENVKIVRTGRPRTRIYDDKEYVSSALCEVT